MASIVEQLILHEGKRNFPYMDSVGKLTIGVGHNLSDNGLSHDQILVILADDIAEAERHCQQYPWFEHLDFVRRKVMLDLMFNLGPGRLALFKRFLRHMAEASYEEAAVDLRHSVWAVQVKARADRLITMMRHGKDYED